MKFLTRQRLVPARFRRKLLPSPFGGLQCRTETIILLKRIWWAELCLFLPSFLRTDHGHGSQQHSARESNPHFVVWMPLNDVDAATAAPPFQVNEYMDKTFTARMEFTEKRAL